MKRVYPGESDGSSNFFAKRQNEFPLVFDTLSPALKRTFIDLALTRAYMEHFFK